MDEYNAATSKFQKSMVAGRIVSMIRNEGGRFLKQKKNNENEWYELSPSEAKSKCSHAIRDAIAISKQRKPSVSSPSIPSSSDSKTEVKEEPEPLVNRGGPVRTWSSNTLVTLTDDGDTSSSEGKDSDDVPIKSLSVSLPEEAPSICAHISDDSWRSSDDEDSSSSDCDDEFEDDFLAYIEKVMGPGPDVRKTVI